MRRRRHAGSRWVQAIVLAALGPLASCAKPSSPATTPTMTPDARYPIVPLPFDLVSHEGVFHLSAATVISAETEPLGLAARFLANHVGRALGRERLSVEINGAPPRDGIALRADANTGSGDGYTLDIRPSGIEIRSATPAGAFHAVQTLRQLLPPAWEYEALRPPRGDGVSVALPALTIRDRPRFEWRGAMLDVARHFLSVDEVKRFIDLMALHKLNRLHLHLSDDQGWRIEIKRWPLLATHGGSTEVDDGPGGYYTQDQYAALVRYAADRFITIVPEIDMPGHTNAALASYGDLNCDGVARDLYTGTEVGLSALCVEKDVTYTFIDDVIREIAALTPGPYVHIGGDEVRTLTADQYASFIERVQGIVVTHGKQMIGWDEIVSARLRPGTIVQHWRPKESPAAAVANGARVIMSVANRTYLDMKYDAATPIGLTWAGAVSVRASYDWDPAVAVTGVPESALLGIEAPLWSETLANIRDFEQMAFPRLAALAEVAWSPQGRRAWPDFRARLGAQGPRWTALGLNFHRSSEVTWR